MESGSWSFPGGALERDEEPLAGAYREVEEEIGHRIEGLVVGEHVHQPVPEWAYTTYVVDVPDQFVRELEHDWETEESGWFTEEEMRAMRLHPAFKEAWEAGDLLGEKSAGEKARVWIKPYKRDGEDVEGYWRDIDDSVAEWAQQSFDYVASKLPPSLTESATISVVPDEDFKLKMEQYDAPLDPTTLGAWFPKTNEILFSESMVNRFRSGSDEVWRGMTEERKRHYLNLTVAHEWGHVAHWYAPQFNITRAETEVAEQAALDTFRKIRYWNSDYARTSPSEAFAHGFAFHLLGNKHFGEGGKVYDKVILEPRTREEMMVQSQYERGKQMLENFAQAGALTKPLEESMKLLEEDLEDEFGPNWREILESARAKLAEQNGGKVWDSNDPEIATMLARTVGRQANENDSWWEDDEHATLDYIPPFVYRVMSEEDYQQSLIQGWHQSDERWTYPGQATRDPEGWAEMMEQAVPEGTVAGYWAELGYLANSPTGIGRVVKIKVDPADGWQKHEQVDYLQTFKRIPVERFLAVSEPIRSSFGFFDPSGTFREKAADFEEHEHPRGHAGRFRRKPAVIPFEAAPGFATAAALAAAYMRLTVAERRTYTREKADAVAEYLNEISIGVLGNEGPGVYEGQVNPGWTVFVQTEERKGEPETSVLSSENRALLDDVAVTIGEALHQDAAVWTQPFYRLNMPRKEKKGALLNIGRNLTDEEAAQLNRELGDDVPIIHDADGALLLNITGQGHDAFRKRIRDAAASINVNTVQLEWFAHDGNYISRSEYGEHRRIGSAGKPQALQARADLRLQERSREIDRRWFGEGEGENGKGRAGQRAGLQDRLSKAGFEEHEHPRGRGGRFREKPDALTDQVFRLTQNILDLHLDWIDEPSRTFWFRPKTQQSFRTSAEESRNRRNTLRLAVAEHSEPVTEEAVRAFSERAANEIRNRAARAKDVGYEGPQLALDWQLLVMASRFSPRESARIRR